MKRDYATLFAEVRAILNRHDPVGLIRMGMPEDEYEPEVGTILPRLREAAGPQDVQRVLHEEFQHWFGSDTSMFGYEEFAPAASEVWEAFERFRKGSEPPA
jgi:hypothetical protein